MRDIIVQALVTATQARGLLLRSAASVRQIEGIDEFDESVGEVPDSALVHEGDAIFAAPLRTGQKTGYFFDQRDNRTRLGRYVAGKRVLDVYSYIGTWGIRAMKFGASHVTCVDSSPLALDVAHENAQRNAVDIHTCRGDALEVLNAYAADGQRFEVVVIDPPALVKRRKDLAAGQTLYQRLNAAAMKVLERSGVLVSSSCSHHLEPAMLQRIILAAAKQERRAAQILEKHAHPPDHPIHPAMPETEYLKAFFVRT